MYIYVYTPIFGTYINLFDIYQIMYLYMYTKFDKYLSNICVYICITPIPMHIYIPHIFYT